MNGHDVLAICVDGDRMFAHMHPPLTARLGETTYLSTQRQFGQCLLLTGNPLHSEHYSTLDSKSRQIHDLIASTRQKALAYT